MSAPKASGFAAELPTCGYRLNVMRRWVGVVAMVILTSCSTPVATGPGPDINTIGGDWDRLPKPPLSARYGSRSVALEGRLYVLGGTDAELCPPNADCKTPTDPFFTDGAVYDPSSGAWDEIADTPIPIGHGSSSVVDGKLYLLVNAYGSAHPSTRAGFLSYSPGTDRWEELSLPPNHEERVLTSRGPRVVAFQASQENGVKEDLVFDPDSDSWSELSPDPLRASFDRWMVWTDGELVLTAIENVPQPGSDGPALYRAAVFADDEWKAFGESQIFGYNPEWSWTAGMVLNPSNERADGGETNNWGKTYNAGGTFDPSTGEWGLLPNPPHGRGEFEGFSAAGDRYAIAYSGWVYDALDERWTELTRPGGAPDADLSAVWVGNELYLFGGVRWDGSDAVILDDAWMWGPGGPD